MFATVINQFHIFQVIPHRNSPGPCRTSALGLILAERRERTRSGHAMIECQKSYHFLGSFGVLPQLLHPCAGEVRSCDYEGTRSQDLNQGWLFPKIAQIFWPNEVRPRPRSRGLPTLLHEIPQELNWPHNLTYFALIFTKPLARLDKPTKFRWTRWYLHIYFIAVVILTLIL